MERIYLMLETSAPGRPTISIPFLKLKYLDEFTANFEGRRELIDTLYSLIDMPVDKYRVESISVLYAKDDTRTLRKLPVKYSVDDYDLDSLREAYIKFFDDDHDRIGYKKYGLAFINNDAIVLSIAGVRKIVISEIAYAVGLYLKGYMNQRSAYFNLKNFRVNGKRPYLVKTKAEVASKEVAKEPGNVDVFNNEIDKLIKANPENSHFTYLKKYAALGEEEQSKAMEILFGRDEEEIHPNKTINRDDKLDLGVIELQLNSATGHDINELNAIINSGISIKEFNGGRRTGR